MEERVGQDYSIATIKRYKTTLSHLKGYIHYKLKLKDIALVRVNLRFVIGFEEYLKATKQISHNSIMKYQALLKKIVREAVNYDLMKKNPYSSYPITLKRTTKHYLSEEELDILFNKDFSTDRLNQVRDIFVFCCMTGLAYIDVASLTTRDIITIGDKLEISKPRQKTGQISRIPLLPKAEAIINKYNDHHIRLFKGKALPVLSNQKMNSYLKEIATICEIDKPLTTHVARHTFATMALSNDVPLKTVSIILGHTSVKMTEHYAKLTDKKLHSDMDMLRGKFG